jgi:hypothetical protein
MLGCTEPKRHKANPDLGKQWISAFINRFKVLNLPFSTTQICVPDSSKNRELVINDSTFIGFGGPCITIGLLPDTSKYYAFIYGVGTECYLPILLVLNKYGEKIATEPLAEGCEVGPGYECFDSLIILTNSSIIHRKVEYIFEPDKSFEEARDVAKREIKIEKFIISNNGLITKEDEK